MGVVLLSLSLSLSLTLSLALFSWAWGQGGYGGVYTCMLIACLFVSLIPNGKREGRREVL